MRVSSVMVTAVDAMNSEFTVDGSVPVAEAEDHAARFGGPAVRVHVVGGAGHNFGTRHPCERPGPALTEALGVTGDFFESTLVPRA